MKKTLLLLLPLTAALSLRQPGESSTPPCCLPAPGFAEAADPDGGLPDLKFLTLEGETLALQELAGKPVVLFVMASWCLTCVSEARALGKLHEKYGDRIAILAVDVDRTTTPERLSRFKKAAGNPDYIWVMDPEGKLVRAFRVRTLDTTIIFDAQGQVIYRDERPTSFRTLDEVIGKLVKGA